MKLYIKQKVFTLGDTFTVMNESGETVYTAEGEIFTFGKKLHVYDTAGNEVIYLEQRLFAFRYCFDLTVMGQEAGSVRREISFFHPVFTLDVPGWDIEGDFFAHEYTVTENGREVAAISKEWMTWGDSYELTVHEDKNALTALAVMLAIDCINAAASN